MFMIKKAIINWTDLDIKKNPQQMNEGDSFFIR